MADLKITELAEDVAPDSDDLFVTVKDSDGINRKVSIGNLVASIQNGGVNEISVAGLSGLLADDQHVLDAEVRAAQVGFGAPVAKSIDTIYQATTDGILVGSVEEPSLGYGCMMTVYSDAATPPTTNRGAVLAEYTNATYTKYASISVPILKSDYYKVTKGNFGLNNSGNEVFTIYFYPLGS
jgi:hypothetical protein